MIGGIGAELQEMDGIAKMRAVVQAASTSSGMGQGYPRS